MKSKIALLITSMFLCTIPTYASYMPEYTLAELVEKSPSIIRGHVVDVNPHVYNEKTEIPYTVITIKVSQSIKGSLKKHDTFQLALIGGFSPKGTFGFVAGAPVFKKGEDLVLFTRKIGIEGFGTVYGITAFSQSKFIVDSEKVYRPNQDILKIDKNNSLSVSKDKPLDYSSFVNEILKNK